MTRRVGPLCSLLLLWLCALGGGPMSPSVAQPSVVRGAAERALRDVADVPLLVSRPAVPRVALQRVLPDRHATPGHSFATPAVAAPATADVGPLRALLLRQADGFRRRPRWRAYDAAAPPVPSRLAH